MNKTVHRELEVAFSKHAQPILFRIAKWIVIIAGVYVLHDNEYFWFFVSFFTVGGLTVHFLWRFKTKGWSQSWVGWDYEKNKPNEQK